MAIKFLNAINVDSGVLYTDVVNDRVGIGTTTTNTISGTNPTLTLGGTSISGGLILQKAGTDTARLYENAGYMVHQGMSGIGHHFYVNAATQAMVIDTGGNVGIGTTSPQSKLQVAYPGNVNGGSMLLGQGGSGTAKWSFLAGTHYDQATGSGNGVGSAGVALIGSYASVSGNAVYIGGGPYEINAATSIEFYTNSTNLSTAGGSLRMNINSAGDISSNGIYQSNASLRAPIFYDSNNTGYYGDFAGTSVLNGLTVQGYALFGAGLSTGSWYGDLASYGYTRETGLSMTGGSEFVVLSKSGQGSVLVDGAYLAYESSNGFFGSYNSAYGNLTGIQATAANTLTVKQLDGGAAILSVTQDVRAPIFYEYNNTSYYLDPASTSNLNTVTAAQFNGPLSGNATTATEAQNNYFYVRGTDPSIRFVDSTDNSTRWVHHNGGSIGFLDSGGSWVLRCDNSASQFYGTVSATNLSGTNTGDQTNIAGNAGSATVLQTARTIAGVSFNGSANISLNNNAITNGAGYITSTSGTSKGANQNYVASSASTSNRGNYGAGVWAYSGFSTGTNRPFTYDATLQVMPTSGMGFELSVDWVSQVGTPLKIRSLRDCCQGWSDWTTVWTSATDGAGSGLDADLLDGQQGSYYAPATGGSYLPLAGGVMTGNVKRSSAIVGFLEGSFNNVGDNGANSNPIYTIGSSYNPASTTLANMYGIGYCNSPSASFITKSGATGWGMYVAADGDARVWLDGETGNISGAGSVYASAFYDSNNTGYYLDPASTSNMNAITWSGGNSSHLGTGAAVTTYVGNSTVNNAAIRSNSNTEDMWIMNWGDSAAWGIYNRNIDSALVVANAITVPANSTAFIGGSLAKSYICHADGNIGTLGSITASNMYASTFYDSNNTGYYLDPASTSILNQINAGVINGSEIYSSSWLRNNNSGTGLYNQATSNHWYSDGPYWNVGYYGSAFGIKLRYGHSGAVSGTLHGESNGQFGLLDNDNAWAVRIQTGTSPLELRCNDNIEFQVFDSYTLSLGSSRAPIFYDSNNTGYYLDPASTSNLNVITAAGTMTATNFILSSDERKKTKIKDLSCDNIDISWKSFEMKSDEGEYRVGVIAQELEIKHPEFVNTDNDGFKSVKYIDLLIAKIAELEARLEKAGI